MTSEKYVFDDEPICGYWETVTVSNLPDFATHNRWTSDFTIPKNSDLNILGEYTVNLRSEICVPDDYTQATCTLFEAEYDFIIVVESCVVSDYYATQKVPEIIYNIGAPSLINIGQYIFDEDANCGY